MGIRTKVKKYQRENKALKKENEELKASFLVQENFYKNKFDKQLDKRLESQWQEFVERNAKLRKSLMEESSSHCVARNKSERLEYRVQQLEEHNRQLLRRNSHLSKQEFLLGTEKKELMTELEKYKSSRIVRLLIR